MVWQAWSGKAWTGKARSGTAGADRQGGLGELGFCMAGTVWYGKQGARIKADAQQAGILCSKLETEGRLTAKALLDESRAEGSPLHDEFEWNDGIAAEKYRENQARHIINCLVTVHESASPTRSFFNIECKTAEYRSVTAIMQNSESRDQLLSLALRELDAFKQKFSSLSELAAVFAAIEEIQEKRSA